MKIKLPQFGNHYEQLEGSGAFVEAVNKRVSDYWGATGDEMPVDSAAFDVLAELYDEIKKPL